MEVSDNEFLSEDEQSIGYTNLLEDEDFNFVEKEEPQLDLPQDREDLALFRKIWAKESVQRVAGDFNYRQLDRLPEEMWKVIVCSLISKSDIHKINIHEFRDILNVAMTCRYLRNIVTAVFSMRFWYLYELPDCVYGTNPDWLHPTHLRVIKYKGPSFFETELVWRHSCWCQKTSIRLAMQERAWSTKYDCIWTDSHLQNRLSLYMFNDTKPEIKKFNKHMSENPNHSITIRESHNGTTDTICDICYEENFKGYINKHKPRSAFKAKNLFVDTYAAYRYKDPYEQYFKIDTDKS